MVAIVVIAHQPLASALVAAAKHVYSRDPCAASRELLGFDVAPDADASASLAQAKALLQQVNKGQGVLVLTDIPGATPGNIASRLAQAGQVAVITGVNMPMLLRSLCYCELSLEELVGKALAGGTGGIQNLAATGDATQKSS
ncbi:MAG TPA: PTS fructose transporter subunit IIA [Burkholderiaceae bacterium]|nr:PTS fructose transporter subunit IIA [Burkholderiaceae bacterium]HYA75446.1 PTS fructose transporter subunit IIA [Burkholderiaceae bacterium]